MASHRIDVVALLSAPQSRSIEGRLTAFRAQQQVHERFGTEQTTLTVTGHGADRLVTATLFFTDEDAFDDFRAWARDLTGVRKGPAGAPAIRWHVCLHDGNGDCVYPPDATIVEGE